MLLKSKYIQDVAKIMGVEREMVRFLPELQNKTQTMNPWVRQLPGIFRSLKFNKATRVLDIPCGEGGVSVPLAKKYKVKVTGFDILPEYVRNANKLAAEQGIGNLCKFKVQDIREVIKKRNICDVLLWVAPPHLWDKAIVTIRALRTPVTDGGLIFIADAYLCSKAASKYYRDYESMDETTKGYISYGDKLARLVDYQGSLWKGDYQRAKKTAQEALEKIDNINDQRVIKRYLKSLSIQGKRDIASLGLAIWILKVTK